MKRSYLFFSFLIMLFLLPGKSFQQEVLKSGTTRLQPKTLELTDDLKCTITPEIGFDTNNRHELSIKLNAYWYDKNKVAVDDPDNVLFIIENPGLFRNDNKGKLTFQGSSDKDMLNQKKPLISENSKTLNYDPIPNGYAGFNGQSMEFILKIDGSENNIFKANFSFAYCQVKGTKKVFWAANKLLSWNFSIPGKPKAGNECEAKVNIYNNRINSLNSKYESFAISNLLSRQDALAADVDNKYNECNAWLETAGNLNDSIINDPNLDNCQKDRNSLLNSLKITTGIAESDAKLLSQKVAEAKKKPVTNKEATKTEPVPVRQEDEKPKTGPAKAGEAGEGIKALTERYQASCNDLSAEFAQLNARINAERSSIQSRLNNNAKRILEIKVMTEKKAQLSPGSQKQMLQELDTSKSENQNNYNANQSLLVEVREFKARIESEKSLSESDFLRLEKKEMPAEGKKIQETFEWLFEKASILESDLELVNKEIGKQNTDLSGLIIMLQGNEEMSATISHFNDSFIDLLSKLSLLQVRIKATGDDFEAKRFSKLYFKWSKDKLLARVDEISQGYFTLIQSYDSLVSSKEIAFKKYDFVQIINSQQEFEKAEAGFGSRIETLKKTISAWDAMPFPYIKAILAIVIITILAFGLYIYFRALRKKKILQSIIKPAAKAQPNIIKIQNADADKPARGIGFLHELQTSGGNYLELDLSMEWDDSAVTKLYFERSCIIKTYRFFEDSIHSTGGETSANETGGYLIGQWDHDPSGNETYIVSLEDFIEPGDDASFSKYQLNFGAKIGVKLQSVLDNDRKKSGRDFVLTAWFHSHPGLKIFLSDYDLTVQEDFAGISNKLKMIALVLDPYTPAWDLGIFSYKINGQMNNASDSKKFFSFDSMYRWALNPQALPQTHSQPRVQPILRTVPPLKSMPPVENYFSYNMTGIFPGSPVRKVYFSIPSIIELKRFIEDSRIYQGSGEVFALLAGDKYTHSPGVTDLLIENLILEDARNHTKDIAEKEVAGLIACLSGQDEEYIKKFQDWLHSKVDTGNQTDLILLINPDKNSLLAFPLADISHISVSIRESTVHIFLSELVEWTRKRK
jgi:hypothetical protein